MTKLILASSSPHRRKLLGRLGLPFEAIAPNVDETPLAGEAATELVERLSVDKARAVAVRHSDALVIGSDQIAVVAEEAPTTPLGKPNNRSEAIEQIGRLSGQRVRFLTGLCVMASGTDPDVGVEITEVVFRDLTKTEITAYVDREQPYGCAASFRSERLGVTLVASIRGDDPNALIGLPLIRLCDMLRRAGLSLPG